MDVVPRSPIVESPWTPRRLRAPREDFSVLAVPPLPDALHTAQQNHDTLAALDTNLQGRTVRQMREWARKEVFAAARDYTSQLLADVDLPHDTTSSGAGESGAPPDSGLLFVAGHQPALFHPGVWVKNFAVFEMARRIGGTSLNLSVDTDIMPSTRIRVPIGNRENPQIERVPFDADRPRGPWEENAILDGELFESFGRRVEELMASWHVTPLVRDLWPEAVRASRKTSLLSDCLIAARSSIERKWGAGNLELPVSHVCQLDPFLWFAGHILAHLPRFCAIHNEILAEYRRLNHVRSRTHPVPELTAKDGWIEAPFWVWRRGENVRGRLFARQSGREMTLSDGKREFARFPLSPSMDACCAVKVLRELPKDGVRLRPRALATTLFSRLCLADLFVHGIGGAKYDEMTDRIFSRFFGIPVPGFLTLTATLHAAFAQPFPVSHTDELRLMRSLRDLRWNADRLLSPAEDPQTAALIAEKRGLVAAMAEPEAEVKSRSAAANGAQPPSNYERFKQLQEVNRQLAGLAAGPARCASDELSKIRHQLEANAVFRDREFAFCLYQGDKLHRLMTSLWPGRE